MALRVRNPAGREFKKFEMNSTHAILVAIGLFFTGSLITLAFCFASMECRVSEYFE